jgi:hypothetical protein
MADTAATLARPGGISSIILGALATWHPLCLVLGSAESMRERSLYYMGPDELECRLRERLDALGPAPRAELLHVLMLPDFDRADRIGEFWGTPRPARSPSY